MEADKKVIIKTEVDTTGVDDGLKDIDKKIKSYDISKTFSKGLSKIGGIIKGFVGSIGNVLSIIGTIAKGLITTILKVSLMAMGISTALGAVGVGAVIVGKAFSSIIKENEQLISNIKYLVFVIGQMLAPAANSVANFISQSINHILNLLAKVLTYIAYIVKAWFGINLLADVSAEAFMAAEKNSEKTANNLKKGAKNAKEMKKQLAGFDEMNVLQDNNTGAGTGGGAGSSLPMPTLEFGNAEIPEWIKWIAKNKDIVLAALAGIASALAAVALGLNLIMATGIGLVVAGIVLLIQDIIKFLKDPTWNNFANILRDISLILAGLAIIMIAINAANPVGWILLAVAAVTALVAVVIKNWDKIKEVLSKVGDWIMKNVIEPVVGFFQGLWDKITQIFSPIIEFYSAIFRNLIDIIKSLIGTIINIVMTVWDNIKIMTDNIMKILKPIFEFVKKYVIDPIFSSITSFIINAQAKFYAFISIIKNIFSPLKDFFAGIINFIWGLLQNIGTAAGNVIGGAFKGVINGILLAIETILNSPIKSINNLIGIINKVPGISLTPLKTFKFPRLAKGGIINMPGKGVMLNGAIGGEGGAEGVIPLTDSQQMALLGEAIGKYININATVPVYVGNRQIAREIRKIEAENDFAYNR